MNTENNKRIAKSTIMLYILILFAMEVFLYTTRIVLDILGVVDFDIYNVVGRVVMMFSFLHLAKSSATQLSLALN